MEKQQTKKQIIREAILRYFLLFFSPSIFNPKYDSYQDRDYITFSQLIVGILALPIVFIMVSIAWIYYSLSNFKIRIKIK